MALNNLGKKETWIEYHYLRNRWELRAKIWYTCSTHDYQLLCQKSCKSESEGVGLHFKFLLVDLIWNVVPHYLKKHHSYLKFSKILSKKLRSSLGRSTCLLKLLKPSEKADASRLGYRLSNLQKTNPF